MRQKVENEDYKYTVSEVAEKLDISPHRIYYMQEKGLIPKKRKFGQILLSENDFQKIRKRVSLMDSMETIKEYCRRKKISRNAFNYRRSRGRIVTVKIGGRVFVREGE